MESCGEKKTAGITESVGDISASHIARAQTVRRISEKANKFITNVSNKVSKRVGGTLVKHTEAREGDGEWKAWIRQVKRTDTQPNEKERTRTVTYTPLDYSRQKSVKVFGKRRGFELNFPSRTLPLSFWPVLLYTSSYPSLISLSLRVVERFRLFFRKRCFFSVLRCLLRRLYWICVFVFFFRLNSPLFLFWISRSVSFHRFPNLPSSFYHALLVSLWSHQCAENLPVEWICVESSSFPWLP